MEHIHRPAGFSRFRLSPSFKGGCRKTKTATPVCRRFCKTKPPSRTQKPPLNGCAAFTIRAKFFWKKKKTRSYKTKGRKDKVCDLVLPPFFDRTLSCQTATPAAIPDCSADRLPEDVSKKNYFLCFPTQVL